MTQPNLIDQHEKVERLCAALSGYLTGAPSPDQNLIDDDLLDLARARHRVAPLLYTALSGGVGSDAKDEPMNALHKLYQQNGVRIMKFRFLEGQLRTHLTKAGIPFAIVKGLELADQLYEHPASRVSKDVDILVSPKHFGAALSALESEGFIIRDERSKKILGPGLFGPRTYARLFKDVTLVHPDLGAQVELHERLFHIELEGFSEKVLESILEADAASIRNPHYCLYLILHGALVHWPRLKMVVDLVLLTKAMSRQTTLECLELAESVGADAAFLASIDFAFELFPSARPADWQSIVMDEERNAKARAEFSEKFRFSLMNSRKDMPGQPPVNEGFWSLSQYIFQNRIPNREVLWRRTAASIAVRV